MSPVGAGLRTPSRRPTALWIAGAVAGIALALVGLLQRPGHVGALPAGVVARVNDVAINGEALGRALEALARDRRTAPDGAERRRVLERLIDEELLVQRALELGMARADRTVRAGLVDAMIASVTAAAHDVEPSPAALERFHAEAADTFRQLGRVRVREIFVRAGEDEAGARARADAAVRRVEAGETIDVVAAALGDAAIAPVPDVLLAPAKLREYVGPTALRAVLSLEVGETTAPIRGSGGYRILELVERRPSFVPPLAGMEGTVRAEYRRRAAERALAHYLADLRARAAITRADPEP